MKRGKIIIDNEICKGCYLCIQACPQKVISICQTPNSSGVYTAEFSKHKNNTGAFCIVCGSCYQVCPDMAIEVYKTEGKTDE